MEIPQVAMNIANDSDRMGQLEQKVDHIQARREILNAPINRVRAANLLFWLEWINQFEHIALRAFGRQF